MSRKTSKKWSDVPCRFCSFIMWSALLDYRVWDSAGVAWDDSDENFDFSLFLHFVETKNSRVNPARHRGWEINLLFANEDFFTVDDHSHWLIRFYCRTLTVRVPTKDSWICKCVATPSVEKTGTVFPSNLIVILLIYNYVSLHLVKSSMLWIWRKFYSYKPIF